MPGKTSQIVRVTTLEMSRMPGKYPSLHTRSNLAIMHAVQIPLAFYRFLYSEIGGSHNWYLRKQMNDRKLREILHSPHTRINMLYCDGVPAGFAELNLSNMPGHIELVYFGLCPEFIGRGLGKWFLGQTVQFAWEQKPEKLVVSTDSLDHPNALPNYQKLGFSPVSYKDEAIGDKASTRE